MANLAGDAIGNVVCSEAGLTLSKMSKGQEFDRRYTARYTVPIDAYAPFAYDAVYVIYDAMERANSVELQQFCRPDCINIALAKRLPSRCHVLVRRCFTVETMHRKFSDNEIAALCVRKHTYRTEIRASLMNYFLCCHRDARLYMLPESQMR